jgi:hypothetical protein
MKEPMKFNRDESWPMLPFAVIGSSGNAVFSLFSLNA